MTLRVGASFGQYDVLPLEGRGGMAEVYRAHDTRLSRDVVLKVLREHHVLDARSAARLHREAHLLASLNHPNIAAIYGLEEHDGVQALVLEYVEGPTLSDRIAQGALPVDLALGVARQIASALEAAHDHGIVHRDVKPSNVKLRPDGTVKVLDFGLATLVRSGADPADQSASTLTAALDAVVGTTPYMSPEQAQGQPVDRRTDIWSFGCVLFEMLTGGRAFGGANAAQTIAAIVSQEPAWEKLPSAVPDRCRTVIERCLQKTTMNRVRDMGDVRLALDGAFTPGAMETIARAPGANRSRTRRAILWVAATSVAAITIVGLGQTPSVPAESLTFELHAPEGAAFARATMEPYPALSPDGRRLAFVAVRGELPSIWLQTIGELVAQALPGMERGSAPFWSPDGQSIGFLADGVVKRVSLSGDRLVQTVSSVAARSGATWMTGGVILFGGADGIYRVPAEGGEALRVTRLDAARGEYSHRWPSAIPGSRSHFAYLVRSADESARGVHLASLEEPSLKKRLVPDDANAAFAVDATGQLRLFFVHEATLLAQSFNPAGARLAGEPVVVARPVVPGETGRLAPFAVARNTLVHRPAEPSLNRVSVTNRHGERLGVVADASTEHRYPSLSPDGTAVALAELDAVTGRLDIWVIDLQRRTRERLTRDSIGALFPVWMPDGRTIVYASGEPGVFDLYSRSARATADATLLFHAPSPVIKYPTDVTNDGRDVLFQSANQEMFRVSLGADRTVSPLPRGLQGRVSPDGRWLAYTYAENAVRQVYVTTYPEATERWRVSVISGEDPQWRGDGMELFYIEAGHTLTAVPVVPGREFRIGAARPLFRATFTARVMAMGPSYAASADGQQFVVVEADRDKENLLRVTTNWGPGTRGGS